MSYSAGLVYREFVKAILESATFFFSVKKSSFIDTECVKEIGRNEAV